MPFLRGMFLSIGFSLFMLAIAAVIYIRPGATAFQTLIAPACQATPDALSVLNLRDPKRSDVSFASAADIRARIAAVTSEANLAGHPVMIFVHGFRTTPDDALCMARLVQTGLRGMASDGRSIPRDVILLSWPGGPSSFVEADARAVEASLHLAALLEGLESPHVWVMAHSLGARVALEAMLRARAPDVRPLDGLVLVQPAIEALSLRRWRVKETISEPAQDVLRQRKGEPQFGVQTSTISGTGCYVAALPRARRIIVTTAPDDTVLNGAFASNAAFLGTKCAGPFLPSRDGRVGTRLPQFLALGTPLEDEYMASLDQPSPTLGTGLSDPFAQPPDGVETYRLQPPDQVWRSEFYDAEFEVGSEAVQFVDLRSLRLWFLPTYWHSPLLYDRMRERILQFCFTSADGGG